MTFAERYADALGRYAADGGEDALSSAYELGRTAVRQGLTVLDLAAAHHEALRGQVTASESVVDAGAATEAAGAFFLEALSAWEMVQRVLQDAREAAEAERRQAAVLRRLSTFLGDASIALDGASSLGEILQLVAEHAREVLSAERCLVRAALDGEEPIVAVAEPEPSADGDDLEALWAAVGEPDKAVRMTGAELARHPARRALEPAGEPAPVPARGWLAAPLAALDGRAFGLVQAFAAPDREFSELDEALLLQLAQMASAAIERAQLYRR